MVVDDYLLGYWEYYLHAGSTGITCAPPSHEATTQRTEGEKESDEATIPV